MKSEEKYTMEGMNKRTDEVETTLVKETIVEKPIPPKKAPKTTVMKVDGTSRLNVRSAPEKDDDNPNIIDTLGRGDLVKVLGPAKENPKFFEIITMTGKTGFVMKEFLVEA